MRCDPETHRVIRVEHDGHQHRFVVYGHKSMRIAARDMFDSMTGRQTTVGETFAVFAKDGERWQEVSSLGSVLELQDYALIRIELREVTVA